jgi:monovalent cation/proton antiporter MnhG/PhaG subunit
MTEVIAAVLLLVGSAVALVAAIGVARLPDAFLRMHAATKAGVVGTGMVLLGAGFAFGDAGAWMRVVLILAFLLVTTPVASHALGRAAYVGGAPMWAGTFTDQLQGVLARRVFDIDPARVPRAARHSATNREDTAMSVLTFGNAAPHHAPTVAPAAPRRILLALAGGPEAAPRLAAALRALRASAAEVTLLSLVCRPTLERTGPVPIGGLHWAKRLAAHRLAAARAAAATLAAEMEAECRALGLPCRLRHEEGDATAVLALAAAHHDVTVLADGAWFDQGQALAPEEAARRLARLSLGPQLLLGAAVPAIRRVLVLQDGSAEAGAAFARFLALGVASEARLTVAALDLPGAEAARAEALALAEAHGREAEALPGLLHPDHPPALPGERPDLLVLHRASDERSARRALRAEAAAVMLA